MRSVVHKIFHGASITAVGCHGYRRVRDHEIFSGTSITAVDWHGCGRGRGTYDISRKYEIIRYGTVMWEVGAHKLFHGGIISLVGRHGYGRSRHP